MWIEENLNPISRSVHDCAVRAVAKVLDMDWETAYIKLAMAGYQMGNLPNANEVISAVLRKHGFYRAIPEDCPDECPTVDDFLSTHKEGRFLIGCNEHVVAAVDGNYYDIWDSGDEPVLYYWYQKETTKNN